MVAGKGVKGGSYPRLYITVDHLPVVAGICLGVRLSMGSLGVLDLGSLDRDSVGDHGHVLAVPVAGVGVTSVPLSVPTPVVVAIVPGSVAALGLSDGSEMCSLGVCYLGSIGGNDSAVCLVSLGLGDRRKVHVLGVSNLSSVDDTAIGSKRGVSVDGRVGGLSGQSAVVGSEMGRPSGLDLRGVQWHSVVDDDRSGVGVPRAVGGSLVDAVSQTGMGGEMGSLGSLDLGSVVGHSGDGGMSSQVSSPRSLDLRGVDWDSVVSDHDRRVGGTAIVHGRVGPWSAVGKGQ